MCNPAALRSSHDDDAREFRAYLVMCTISSIEYWTNFLMAFSGRAPAEISSDPFVRDALLVDKA